MTELRRHGRDHMAASNEQVIAANDMSLACIAGLACLARVGTESKTAAAAAAATADAFLTVFGKCKKRASFDAQDFVRKVSSASAISCDSASDQNACKERLTPQNCTWQVMRRAVL